jgi:hypothetical protein
VFASLLLTERESLKTTGDKEQKSYTGIGERRTLDIVTTLTGA